MNQSHQKKTDNALPDRGNGLCGFCKKEIDDFVWSQFYLWQITKF